MEAQDVHLMAQVIKAHTDLTIIFEATSRLLKEITEISHAMNKQEATSGKLFSKN